MLKIDNIKVEPKDKNNIKQILANKLKVNINNILDFNILKESLDARDKPIYIYSIAFNINNETKYLKYKNITKYTKYIHKYTKLNTNKEVNIIGFGPSGIFAAYILAKSNIKVNVFERGSRIEKRVKDVNNFWTNQILNPNSNVQFGEGGAGTFSDGKLTTRIKDDRINIILDVLIENGASPSIRYEANPHIGTDKLRTIITNIEQYLISKNVTFYFDTKVEQLIIENNSIIGLIANNTKYYSDDTILAIGHSAIDTIITLHKQDIYMEPKDFAIGVRVEHPQQLINKNQYKQYYTDESLPTASYRLTHTTTNNVGVYSFCMCPGGYVVSSSSDPNTIVTNGMSYSDRSNTLANSAILVQVKNKDIMYGINYQKAIEKKAYEVSNSYNAPSMNIKDYMNNTLTPLIFNSSYLPNTTLYNLNNLFDDHINTSLKQAFLNYDKKINNFINQGIMIAVESRSSSTIRIKRNEKLESLNHTNLYPTGEGAGYAGGIISSCLDGLRVGETIIDKYKKFT